MDFLLETLDNGIRLVHYQVHSVVAHCGLIINTGSEKESDDEHGLVHLIEHMLFKGTKHRKAFHILSRLEDVGGELNAYTTKEETAVYASFLAHHYERAIELISDVISNSVFPIKEIENEKEVIIEEINSYKDNPGELIFDEFEEIIFKDQPIGRNILGKPETVRLFTREKVMSFIRNNYNTDQMVFCSVGNISNTKLLTLFKKYFSAVPEKRTEKKPARELIYIPSHNVREMNTWQCHCITGNIAYNLKDNRRMGMFLINNILGGQGLNSRLNMSLREKNGLAYNVESNYNPYCETGVFSVYFGTDKQNLEKSIDITERELNKLRTTRLGPVQLSKARNQIKGYLARGYENYESLMLSLGKSMMVFNTIETLEDQYKRIDFLTSSELLETANDIFDKSKLSTLIYK
jgi:predicted Zn-dependent peptidase